MDELLRQIDIPAMEQAMSKQYKSQIRRRWELPADYWMLLERCCGLRTVWSNDTYEALELWGLDTLVKGQEGYAYNPVEQKVWCRSSPDRRRKLTILTRIYLEFCSVR